MCKTLELHVAKSARVFRAEFWEKTREKRQNAGQVILTGRNFCATPLDTTGYWNEFLTTVPITVCVPQSYCGHVEAKEDIFPNLFFFFFAELSPCCTCCKQTHSTKLLNGYFLWWLYIKFSCFGNKQRDRKIHSESVQDQNQSVCLTFTPTVRGKAELYATVDLFHTRSEARKRRVSKYCANKEPKLEGNRRTGAKKKNRNKRSQPERRELLSPKSGSLFCKGSCSHARVMLEQWPRMHTQHACA